MVQKDSSNLTTADDFLSYMKVKSLTNYDTYWTCITTGLNKHRSVPKFPTSSQFVKINGMCDNYAVEKDKIQLQDIIDYSKTIES